MSLHKITKNNANHFQRGLYEWNRLHPRPMPWKGEKDPYKIWLSEIILQQTRVEQGLPYYHRFIQSFPTVHHLAKASLQKVLKHWEGLGYYTRARNLHHSARHISTSLAGLFPVSFDEIKKLKGIGVYTASAIVSFAYDLPYAVLDGNVHRILSRYLGIKKTMENNADKKYFQFIANQLLDLKQPGHYNQAIMDFGAMCCLPKLPLCKICPLQKNCFAFNQNKIEILPPSKKKIIKKKRHFHYFIFKDHKNQISVQQRSPGDVWADLFEFPLVESTSGLFPHHRLVKKISKQTLISRKPDISLRQTLSHQSINAYIYFYKATNFASSIQSVPINTLNKLAMPGILAKQRKIIIQKLKMI